MPSEPTSTKFQAPPAAHRRRRYWLVRLFALGFGIAVALIMTEVGLRIAGIEFPNFYETNEFCGFRLRKHASGMWTHEGQGYVAINSLGFRGPEFAAEKPANVFRIAVLGDSFIEARQVEYEQTFCSDLERLLNRRANGTRQFEVINCGVSGYGTAQELLLLEHVVLPLKPDAVLLAIYPDNDVRNNSRVLEGDTQRPYFSLTSTGQLDPTVDFSFRQDPAWIAQNSASSRVKETVISYSRLLQFLKEAKRGKLTMAGPPQNGEALMVSDLNQVRYVYEPTTDPHHQAAWQITRLLLERMQEMCEQHHVPLFTLNVSSSLQAWPDPAYRQHLAAKCKVSDLLYSEHRLEEICNEANISFLPLASALQRTAELRSEFLHGFPNLAEGVGHWNEQGNEVAAEITADWLWPQVNEALMP